MRKVRGFKTWRLERLTDDVVMRGVRRHSLQLVRMVAFCVDILSPGRPSLFHWATVASSVSMDTGSMPSVIGIGIW